MLYIVLLPTFTTFFLNILLVLIELTLIDKSTIYSINIFDFLYLNSTKLKLSEKVVLEHSLFSQINFLFFIMIITFYLKLEDLEIYAYNMNTIF